jgi:pectinesterase
MKQKNSPTLSSLLTFSTLLILVISFAFVTNQSFANTPPKGKEQAAIYIIDKLGSGDYTSIQAAIDATIRDKEVVLFIKPGEYNEKLFITRNNLSLIGSSEKNTIIKFAELRNNWRKNHSNDWGAAVVNINASDINLINLSVINNYGRLHNTDSHQFAIRGFENTNRVILHQCTVIADGADTVSLWNKETGMYYHSYCHFEGYTDMVCPRGWALIENSTFFNHKQSATIWHDGELHQDQKLVVNNSSFDGIKDFWLGRHHYDAQFYVIKSQFSQNMADKPIFKKKYNDKGKNRANLYGDRYFFSNNLSANQYPWTADNFSPNNTYLKNQTLEEWVFNKKWYPNQVIAKLNRAIEIAKFKADKLTVNK